MKQKSHTPTPWEYNTESQELFGADDSIVMDFGIMDYLDPKQASKRINIDAEHIVHCVNSHEKLKAMNEELLRVADEISRKAVVNRDCVIMDRPDFDRLQKAVQKATELNQEGGE